MRAADAAVESAVSEETGVLAGHVQWLPRRVLRDVKVAALACGMDHSVAVAGDDQPQPELYFRWRCCCRRWRRVA